MTPNLIIIGASGFGREVAQLVDDINAAGSTRFNLLGFVDDDPAKIGTEVGGRPVLGDLAWLTSQGTPTAAAFGIGAPHLKARIRARLDAAGIATPPLIHPSTLIGERVALGPGVVITARCVITTDIRIGRDVTLNLGCTVGHDTVIHDIETLAPGVHVSGAVTIGEGADLGTGPCTIQGVRIGAWSVLGVGAVAISDVPRDVVAVGVPARVARERPEGWHLV